MVVLVNFILESILAKWVVQPHSRLPIGPCYFSLYFISPLLSFFLALSIAANRSETHLELLKPLDNKILKFLLHLSEIIFGIS